MLKDVYAISSLICLLKLYVHIITILNEKVVCPVVGY